MAVVNKYEEYEAFLVSGGHNVALDEFRKKFGPEIVPQIAYVKLPIDEIRFLQVYDFFYDLKFNKEHPPVTEEQLGLLLTQIAQLERRGIDDKMISARLEEHYWDIPETSAGITAFFNTWCEVAES